MEQSIDSQSTREVHDGHRGQAIASARGSKNDLRPWGIVTLAYSPIEHASDGQSALLKNRVLK